MSNYNSLDTYFRATLLSQKAPVPSKNELESIEKAFILNLIEIKKVNDYDTYKFIYGTYGRKIVARMSYLNRYQGRGDEVLRLYQSCGRLLNAVKDLDRCLYESTLRTAINRGKRLKADIRSEKANISSNQQQNACYTFLNSISRGDTEVNTSYHNLIKSKLIDDNLSLSEYLFLFGGNGAPTNKKFRWNETVSLLSLFLRGISDDDKLWVKAEQIVERFDAKAGTYKPISHSTLRTSYRKAQLTNKSTYTQTTIEELFV